MLSSLKLPASRQSLTSRFLEPQVLMQFLPSVPWFSEGGVTVMDSCELGTNKSL